MGCLNFQFVAHRKGLAYSLQKNKLLLILREIIPIGSENLAKLVREKLNFIYSKSRCLYSKHCVFKIREIN